jgi:hypothetical protein
MAVVRREVKVAERIIVQMSSDTGGIHPVDLTASFHNLGGARPLFKAGGVFGFSPTQLRDIADFMENPDG